MDWFLYDNGLRHERVKSVPKEITGTSRLRQSSVPAKNMQKTLVMETTFQKKPSSKGIESALYDPRKVDNRCYRLGKN